MAAEIDLVKNGHLGQNLTSNKASCKHTFLFYFSNEMVGMPAYPIEELQARIGKSKTTARDLHVEAGKVDEFARAITDRKPEYFNESVAQAHDLDTIPAPPTFLRTWYFDRYRPEKVGVGFGFDLGLDPRYTIHGQQEYQFQRPVYVGDVLTGKTTLTDVYQRGGDRAGKMTFVVFETEYLNREGKVIVSVENTRIETDGAINSSEGVANDELTEPVDASAERQQWDKRRVTPREVGAGPKRLNPNIASVGDRGPELHTDKFDRLSFVQYAGASGDFNPLHYNEPFAHRAGHRSVFAQGMLVAGVASRFVTDWIGVRALTRFKTRFISQVWPGNRLTVTGEVLDITRNLNDVDVELEFHVRNENENVLEGTANASYNVA